MHSVSCFCGCHIIKLVCFFHHEKKQRFCRNMQQRNRAVLSCSLQFVMIVSSSSYAARLHMTWNESHVEPSDSLISSHRWSRGNVIYWECTMDKDWTSLICQGHDFWPKQILYFDCIVFWAIWHKAIKLVMVVVVDGGCWLMCSTSLIKHCFPKLSF